MKRKTRKFLMVLAMATISAFGVLFASCGAGDWLNEKVDQLTCKHEYDDGIELETATCSEYGKVLKTCTICYYEKTEKIDKLPHTETVVAAEAPTCTKDGKTDGVVCSVCDEIIVRQKSVPKLGHDITILEAVEPTCLTSGKTEGKYCNRCNETVVEQKTISALGHKVTTTYGKAATCTESGLTNGQACARCATVYVAQEVIPATGHTIEDYECTVCGVDGPEIIALMSTDELEFESVKVGDAFDENAIYKVDKPATSESYDDLFTYSVELNAAFEDSLDAEFSYYEYSKEASISFGLENSDDPDSELILYSDNLIVYGTDFNYLATEIRMGFPVVNQETEYSDYDLTLLSRDGVFSKYLVEEVTVSEDVIRYYDIVQLARPYNRCALERFCIPFRIPQRDFGKYKQVCMKKTIGKVSLTLFLALFLGYFLFTCSGLG